MSAELSDQEVQNLLISIKESERLKTLSNEELVRLYYQTAKDDDDLIVEEMAERLCPDWENQL